MFFTIHLIDSVLFSDLMDNDNRINKVEAATIKERSPIFWSFKIILFDVFDKTEEQQYNLLKSKALIIFSSV